MSSRYKKKLIFLYPLLTNDSKDTVSVLYWLSASRQNDLPHECSEECIDQIQYYSAVPQQVRHKVWYQDPVVSRPGCG